MHASLTGGKKEKKMFNWKVEKSRRIKQKQLNLLCDTSKQYKYCKNRKDNNSEFDIRTDN